MKIIIDLSDPDHILRVVCIVAMILILGGVLYSL